MLLIAAVHESGCVHVFGHAETARRCPLTGAKQTSRRKAGTSVLTQSTSYLSGVGPPDGRHRVLRS